jgi:ABC-type glycerol-3-phosphate transport system substrate-binding protein
MFKRILAILLAALMLLPLAACGTTTETPDVTTDGATGTDTEAATEFFPNVEKQDYEGETFQMIGIRDAGTWVYGEDPSAANVNVLNETLYEMNTTVEDHLGINIEYEYVQHITGQSVIFDRVKPSIMAGDDAYQLCILPSYRNVASFVTQDCVMDLYDLNDYIDLDQPYWNREVIESLMIGDHAYIATGDICYYTVHPIYCNKDLLKAAGREIPYDQVRNGTWTLDQYLSLTADLYVDNGDGNVNNQDTFGFAALCDTNINSFMQASDVYVVTRHDDGSFEFSMYGEKLLNLYEKLYNWSKNDSTYIWGWGDRENTNVIVDFLDGRTYFTQDELGTKYLTATFDVGILPLPKYDTAQTSYSHVNWGDNIAVPGSVKNTKLVGETLELLSYYSRTVIRPKFYDEVLELRVSNAPDDREMVETIFNTIVFDPGIAYCDGNSQLFALVYLPKECLLQGLENISSYYQKNERAASGYLTRKIYGKK